MRTARTTVALVAGAALFGLFCRLGQDRAEAAGVPCQQWDCKDNYSWWTGNAIPAKAPNSAELAGTIIPDKFSHTTQALVLFYTPSTVGKKPVLNYGDGNFSKFQWPDHVPDCLNVGVNPTPETAGINGTPATYLYDQPHYKCTPQ